MFYAKKWDLIFTQRAIIQANFIFLNIIDLALRITATLKVYKNTAVKVLDFPLFKDILS